MAEGERHVVVGVTGASGVAVARVVLEGFAAGGFRIHWVLSRRGADILRREAGVDVDPVRPDPSGWLSPEACARVRAWGIEDFCAPVASGSFPALGMAVVPCGMGTLGRIASGVSTSLVERAADVALKEGRPLVLVPRETPVSEVHLRNMLRAARAGATILPAAPAFYFGPRSVEDLAAYLGAKVLERFGIPLPERFRWRGEDADAASAGGRGGAIP